MRVHARQTLQARAQKTAGHARRRAGALGGCCCGLDHPSSHVAGVDRQSASLARQGSLRFFLSSVARRFITQGTRIHRRSQSPKRRPWLSIVSPAYRYRDRRRPCLLALRTHCCLPACVDLKTPWIAILTMHEVHVHDNRWLHLEVCGVLGLGPSILAAVLTFHTVGCCWVDGRSRAVPSVRPVSFPSLSRSSRCCDPIPWALFSTFFSRFFTLYMA